MDQYSSDQLLYGAGHGLFDSIAQPYDDFTYEPTFEGWNDQIFEDTYTLNVDGLEGSQQPSSYATDPISPIVPSEAGANAYLDAGPWHGMSSLRASSQVTAHQGSTRPCPTVRLGYHHAADSGYGTQRTDETRTAISGPCFSDGVDRSGSAKRQHPDDVSDSSQPSAKRNKHDKQFPCEFPGCPRRPFGSEADMRRHMKGKHDINSGHHKNRYWKCTQNRRCREMVPSDRKDNFKQHVERVHNKHGAYSNEEIDKIVIGSEIYLYSYQMAAIRSQKASNRSGSRQPRGQAFDLAEEQSEYDDEAQCPANLCAYYGTLTDDLLPDLTNIEESANDRLQSGLNSGWSAEHDGMTYGHVTMNATMDHSLAVDDLGMLMPDSSQQHRASPIDHSFEEWAAYGANSVLVEVDNVYPYDTLEADKIAEETLVPFNQTRRTQRKSAKGQFKCREPGCTSVKARQCDLDKHMYRHSRPWGCTFGSCKYRSGAKHEWKRHELDQHKTSFRTLFRCDIDRCALAQPATIYYDAGEFLRHLQYTHATLVHLPSYPPRESHPMISAALTQWRIDPDGGERFWCGFCNKIVRGGPQDVTRIKKPEERNWRIKHIGDHFNTNDLHGQKVNSNDWICCRQNVSKWTAVWATEETKRSKKGSRSKF